MSAVRELLARGGAVATVGDLAEPTQIRALASLVNALGHMDAVIHNAGIISGSRLLIVNFIAPYLLACLI